MKVYEPLSLEIEALDSSDVISTSAEVTTDDIVIDWSATSKSAFNL